MALEHGCIHGWVSRSPRWLGSLLPVEISLDAKEIIKRAHGDDNNGLDDVSLSPVEIIVLLKTNHHHPRALTLLSTASGFEGSRFKRDPPKLF